jgi:hypothetical protein
MVCIFPDAVVLKLPFKVSLGSMESQGSSVSIAVGYKLDGLGLICSGSKFFSILSVQTCSRAHPSSYPLESMGTFCSVKWLEHEADHTAL